MSLKIEFAERASKEGAQLAPLCREYGISRQTGHKWLKRFREQGHEGLEERSRRPLGSPTGTAEEMILAVLSAREAHPRWGPKKLALVLRRTHGARTPSRATIARILLRFGKVRERRRKPVVSVVDRAPQVAVTAPNDVWSVDFKGWWRTKDRSRCEPLTVRDAFSRFVLRITVMPGTAMEGVRREFEALFRKYGLPTGEGRLAQTPFHGQSSAITAFRSFAPKRAADSRACRCGGSRSAYASYGLAPDALKTTAATSGCTATSAPMSRPFPMRPPLQPSVLSIAGAKSSTTFDLTKPSTARCLPTSIGRATDAPSRPATTRTRPRGSCGLSMVPAVVSRCRARSIRWGWRSTGTLSHSSRSKGYDTDSGSPM